MRERISQASEWLDNRTGFISAGRQFLSEQIPASAGWPQVFGSVCLFLFLLQAVTGVLLAFNYAPTPGDAYASLSYILRKVAAGRMIHDLHHWGASLMVIAVFLHMAQVFIYGAYKKPRETTWIIGTLLLLLTLAFGLTGYLLPWDNRAYWGTVVTTRIAATVPFFGSLLTALIGATNGVGVVTFSRFYAVHTILLPGTTILLVSIHVALVRRHGIAPSPTDDQDKKQTFYPKQVFRDLIAVSVAFAILFAAVLFLEVPLERIADPTDVTYTPRPEWYFLFLFQLLKFFQGNFEVIGTVVLPSLAVAALVLLPFLHRVHLSLLKNRIQAVALVIVAFAAWAALTAAAYWSTPHPHRSALVASEATEWALIPPEEIAGLGYFRASGCGSCHNLLLGNPKPGPNLGLAGLQHSRPWLITHFRNPGVTSDEPSPPPRSFSIPTINALSLFVENLKPESVPVLQTMSLEFIEGAQTFVAGGCSSCHKVNGVGGGVGPALNGLTNRRSESWVKGHFVSPQKFAPGSIMPPYHFPPNQEKALIAYLFSLSD